jgi:hypothetical protein
MKTCLHSGNWDFHNKYILSSFSPAISTCWLHKQNSYQSSRELSWTYQQWAGVITKLSQYLNDNSCEDGKSKYQQISSYKNVPDTIYDSKYSKDASPKP